MRQRGLTAGIVLFASVGLYGQKQAVIAAATEKSGKTPSPHAPYYIDPLPLHLALILSPPDSAVAASRRIAYSIFGSLAASPDFQRGLVAAREETRRKLGRQWFSNKKCEVLTTQSSPYLLDCNFTGGIPRCKLLFIAGA